MIVSPATQPGHDVDYLFGQVSIDSAFVDWSGNCGVRIWQANIGKTIIAHVPIRDGQVAHVDLRVRALSMGRLHHAMMGTAAVAIGTAAAIPGTLVNLAAGGGTRRTVRFGHPSGTLRVGAEAQQVGGRWQVSKVLMSRSARILMEGWVRAPA